MACSGPDSMHPAVAIGRPRLVLCKSQQGGARMARSGPQVVVRPVQTEQQLQEFKTVTAAYLEWLGEDLSFQQIEAELASLPGSYAREQRGAMLLAYAPAGAVPADDPSASSAAPSSADMSSSSNDNGSDNDCSNGEDSGNGSGGGGATLECVGAVALRPLTGHTSTVPPDGHVAGLPLGDVCEMKRLFVLPGHHGLGAGAALVRALLPAAAELGYKVMVLDTLERLEGANRLYRRLGFEPTERYNDCPLPGVLYFARKLEAEGKAQAPAQQLEGSSSGMAN